MATTTSVGIASGIDLEGLIDKLIQSEGSPTATRLNAREATIQANISAFGTLKNSLSQFQSSLAGLTDPDKLSARTAASSDPSYFTVSSDANAQPGSYAIQVLNLAKAHKLASVALANPDTLVGEGTLTVNVGTSSVNIAVAATDTLADLRDKITDSDSQVTATLITSSIDPDDLSAGTETQLVVTSNSTGSEGEIEIIVDDTGDGKDTDKNGLSRFFFSAGNPKNQLEELDAATDARITVDGFTAISSTNQFADVIDGLTITAQREPEDPLSPETETLTVALDKFGVKSQIEIFVSNYNEAINTIRDLTLYSPDTQTAGPLNGDFTVRSLQSRLRNILSEQVSGTESLSSLAELGITTQRDGTLTIDSAQLDSVLEDSFADVSKIFASENGAATQLDQVLGNYLDSNGLISSRTEGFDSQLKRIADQRLDLQFRLEKIEANFRAQFIALDQLVAQFQSTSDFLSGQLAITANIFARNSTDN